MFDTLIEKIKSAEKIAILNHINPDGDAFGSAYGLKLALLEMGKSAEVFLRPEDTESREYRFVRQGENMNFELCDCDLKIAVDCADLARLGAFSEDFSGETAAIDHHATHKPFSKVFVVVPDAPATGEIIYDLICSMGISLTDDIAYNLYMAIICDTGNFKYSSTTPKTHIVASELMKKNFDGADLAKKLFDTKSVAYLNMYKKAIESLELYAEGRISLLYFSEDDFAQGGITEAEADGIVNLPNSVEGSFVGVYIRQRGEAFKVSLRSAGLVDVSKVAEHFGGGGHICASGFLIKKPISEVKKLTVEEIEKLL